MRSRIDAQPARDAPASIDKQRFSDRRARYVATGQKIGNVVLTVIG